MDAIDITEYLEKFRNHIDLNKRTILSAKFGDGKTYFLDKFKTKYENEFYFITIYPVNYSVAENTDIFEYIKRDIIIQLANDDILSNIDFTSIVDTLFSWENAREVISFLLSFLPAGEFYNKLLSKGKIFYDKYEEKKVTYEKYFNYFEDQKGGLYEQDGYTKLIEKAIEYIQKKDKAKKVVLIFEDLDRIDPAHLFRILNVLGANIDCQFNNKEYCKPNKFGVDNIITVFDYDVTSHIFHHFYGDKANYEGYINKFKENQPFFYSISTILIDYFYKYIDNLCEINKETVNMIPDLKQKICSISIRDAEKITKNIENQIVNKFITDTKFKYSTINQLTLLMAIMYRIGYKKNEISNILSNLINDKPFILLNLIGNYLLSEPSIVTKTTFRYSSKDYNVTISTDPSGLSCMKFLISNDSASYFPTVSQNIFFIAIGKALKNIYD